MKTNAYCCKWCALGEVVAGKKGRMKDDDIMFFKLVGLALEDVSAALRAYDMAQKDGVGKERSHLDRARRLLQNRNVRPNLELFRGNHLDRILRKDISTQRRAKEAGAHHIAVVCEDLSEEGPRFV